MVEGSNDKRLLTRGKLEYRVSKWDEIAFIGIDIASVLILGLRSGHYYGVGNFVLHE